MKKIFSLIFALVMMLSLFTLTVQAAPTGSFEVTYEDASGNPVELKNLANDDIFYATVNVKNTTVLTGFELKFSWKNDVIVPVNSSGATIVSDPTFKNYVTDRFQKEYNDGDSYNVTVKEEITDATFAYVITTTAGADDKLSGDYLIIKIRFKVVASGKNPEFTAVSSKIDEVASGDGDVACIIPAYTGDATEPETPKHDTTKADSKYFAATIVPDEKTATSTNTLIFMFEDAVNGEATYEWNIGEYLTFEGEPKLKFGLEVSGVPSDALESFKLTNVTWKY